MDRQILNITANEQILSVSNPIHISTNKVSYIEARFDLRTNWSGYDSVRAVWFNDFQCISTVLDANGKCLVPFEVMKRKGSIKVNLVGSISDGDVLTDRLTSYPIVAVVVDCVAQITGSETSPITPSQFEQFVDIVNDAVSEVTGMSAEATTLPAGSDATASYQDGVLSFGIPRGNTGATGADGNGIASISKTGTSGLVDTYTVTFTDGQTATFTVTNGAKGDTGNGITSIEKTSTAGLVDTYTVTYTNGTTSTFTVTNGEKGDKGDKGDTGATGERGESGADGFSPIVTVTEITGGHSVSIEDAEQTQTFDVMDGVTPVIPWDSILPTDTASGSIASFPDGTDLVPAKSVVIGIEPIQSGSGTPSRDNIIPISGWMGTEVNVSGKNLANPSQFSTEKPSYSTQQYWIGLTDNGDGTYTETRPLGWGGTGYVFVGTFKAGTYYISADVKDLAGVACGMNIMFKKPNSWDNASQGYVNNGSITALGRYGTSKTISEDFDCYLIVAPYSTNGAQVKFGDIQLELGSTATAYEPYEGETKVIEFKDENDNTLTVYGGNGEIVGGRLTVTKAYALLNDASKWVSSSGVTDVVYNEYFDRKFYDDSYAGLACSIAEAEYSSGFYCRWRGTSSQNFGFKNIGSLTLADFQQMATDGKIAICYDIEPQTYQLTPTDIALLQGQNNVWADTGDTEVTYKADIQGYIDKKINALI